MIVILQGMLDLMCSTDFDSKELPKIRKIFYFAQKMARIGNAINTYPKEVIERDVSSDMILDSLEKGTITFDEILGSKTQQLLDSISLQENEYDMKWSEMLIQIRGLCKKIKSIDLSHYVLGIIFVHQKYYNRAEYWQQKYKNKVHVH